MTHIGFLISGLLFAACATELNISVPDSVVIKACDVVENEAEIRQGITGIDSVVMIMRPASKSAASFRYTNFRKLLEEGTKEVTIPPGFPFVGNMHYAVVLPNGEDTQCYLFSFSPEFKDYVEFRTGFVKIIRGSTFYLIEEAWGEFKNPELYKKLLAQTALPPDRE